MKRKYVNFGCLIFSCIVAGIFFGMGSPLAGAFNLLAAGLNIYWFIDLNEAEK